MPPTRGHSTTHTCVPLLLIVIPAHAGIQGLCLFVFALRLLHSSGENIKNRITLIFIGSGFRHTPE